MRPGSKLKRYRVLFLRGEPNPSPTSLCVTNTLVALMLHGPNTAMYSGSVENLKQAHPNPTSLCVTNSLVPTFLCGGFVFRQAERGRRWGGSPTAEEGKERQGGVLPPLRRRPRRRRHCHPRRRRFFGPSHASRTVNRFRRTMPLSMIASL